MSITGRDNKVIDGQEVLDLWVELGSVAKVLRFFNTEGRVNSHTLQPYNEHALWAAARMFMIRHPDESRVYFSRAGSVFTDEQWEVFILRKAMQALRYQRSTFIRWVLSQKDQWPRKYEALYSQKFPINPKKDYDYFASTTRQMPKAAGRMPKDSKPKGKMGRPRKNKDSEPVSE